jgi:hypothetical protein
MPRLNPLSAPSRLRERRHQRSRRLLASRAVADRFRDFFFVISCAKYH